MSNIMELSRGERAKIVQIQKDNPVYRRKLIAMGLTPGTEFTVKRVAPLGDPVEIDVRGYALSLRKREAALIRLEKVHQ